MTGFRTGVRWLLAGPLALASAIAVLAAMPLWIPSGAAGIDNLVLPLVLFPLIWSLSFFYAVLEENLIRGGFVLTLVIASNGLMAGLAILGV